MAPPLWVTIVGLSVAKKATVLLLGYLYGFPRLYRKSQHVVRYLVKDKQSRERIGSNIRTVFRLPRTLSEQWHGSPALPTGTSSSGRELSAPSYFGGPSFASSSLWPSRLGPRAVSLVSGGGGAEAVPEKLRGRLRQTVRVAAQRWLDQPPRSPSAYFQHLKSRTEGRLVQWSTMRSAWSNSASTLWATPPDVAALRRASRMQRFSLAPPHSLVLAHS